MAKHTGMLEVVSAAKEGELPIFYASASDSLRSYLGKSKFHSSPNCHLLLGRQPYKTIIQDAHVIKDHSINLCANCVWPKH